jgi:hypothetical protein
MVETRRSAGDASSVVGEWDPLDLRGLAPDDEYDSYFNVVAGKLRRHESAAESAEYLSVTERQNMGLGPDARPSDELRPVAERLIMWYETTAAP